MDMNDSEQRVLQAVADNADLLQVPLDALTNLAEHDMIELKPRTVKNAPGLARLTYVGYLAACGLAPDQGTVNRYSLHYNEQQAWW